MDKRNALKLMAKGAFLAGATAILAACNDGPPKAHFNAADLTGADYGKDFSMPDQNGQLRTIADFKGKVTVLFFGYTQCPDVCPTTLAQMAEVKQKLGAKGERLQVIFVSVDPQRDTPEILQAYMASFDPSFLALRGSDAQLAAMTKEFKIFYQKIDGRTPTSYTINHTAGDYIFDPEGRLRLYSRYGAGTQALAQDIEQLIDGA